MKLKLLSIVVFSLSLFVYGGGVSVTSLTPTPKSSLGLTPPGLMAPLVAASPIPVSQNFTISWQDNNPVTRVFTGYHVKYGTVSGGPYPTVVDVIGKGTISKAFSNFPLGRTYMIVTAYDAQIESGPTNELVLDVVVGLVPPSNLGVLNTGLVNMSTRSQVGEGDKVMIAGFILQSEKRVVLRGIGPSLADAGVTGSLNSASIELHDGFGALISTNNGWRTGPDVVELEGIGLAPKRDKESALIALLKSGAYTAIIKGGTGEQGIGLAEVYALP